MGQSLPILAIIWFWPFGLCYNNENRDSRSNFNFAFFGNDDLHFFSVLDTSGNQQLT